LIFSGPVAAHATLAPLTPALSAGAFHQKFGNGNVTAVDGNKLPIHFDKAGEQRGGYFCGDGV
jgi:DNA helicase II / ATP-dependent DNA helicase PcrA